MPQTSPMNWILISNLFFSFLIMNQLMMLSNLKYNSVSLLFSSNKNWLW